nr:MAG TPA: hypothetical protein [Caudoviricetes sp.]
MSGLSFCPSHYYPIYYLCTIKKSKTKYLEYVVAI